MPNTNAVDPPNNHLHDGIQYRTPNGSLIWVGRSPNVPDLKTPYILIKYTDAEGKEHEPIGMSHEVAINVAKLIEQQCGELLVECFGRLGKK